jgi:hypothetical protein
MSGGLDEGWLDLIDERGQWNETNALVELRSLEVDVRLDLLRGQRRSDLYDCLIVAMLAAHQTKETAERDHALSATSNASQKRLERVRNFLLARGEGQIERLGCGRVDLDANGEQGRREEPPILRFTTESSANGNDGRDFALIDDPVGTHHVDEHVEEDPKEIAACGSHDRRAFIEALDSHVVLEIAAPIGEERSEDPLDRLGLLVRHLTVREGDEDGCNKRTLL